MASAKANVPCASRTAPHNWSATGRASRGSRGKTGLHRLPARGNLQRPSHQRHRDRRGRSFGRQGHRIRRGAGGYLCAFSASDLSLKWKSVIAIPSAKTSNYFEWSSPTVANGIFYAPKGTGVYTWGPWLTGPWLTALPQAGGAYRPVLTPPGCGFGRGVTGACRVGQVVEEVVDGDHAVQRQRGRCRDERRKQRGDHVAGQPGAESHAGRARRVRARGRAESLPVRLEVEPHAGIADRYRDHDEPVDNRGDRAA